jgi:hypothetical protein
VQGYRPAGHLRVAELFPESTEPRPFQQRKPEHHVACWFKLSGQSLEEGEGFPQIPVLGRSGSTVETLQLRKGPHRS